MERTTRIEKVAVIGAGPVGLAAAAHLLTQGIEPLVLESGPAVGANLHTYRHVGFFSPWRYNLDKAAVRLLYASGWQAPALDELPTAGEFVERYLEPLAALPQLAGRILLGHRVTAITRAGADKVKTAGREQRPFLIRVTTPAGEQEFTVDAVLDATGTWSTPNPLGADGVPALGETALRHRIVYGMPDVLGTQQTRYAGRKSLVVGAGHSAAGTLLSLAELAERNPDTRIVWAVRGAQLARVFGGGEADGLPARGALGARLKSLQEQGRLELHKNFRIRSVREQDGTLTVVDGAGEAIAGIDNIVCATGARPDLSITRELRVRRDPWLESTDALAPLIDPNEHSCGTVRPHGHRELAHPERDYYAIGAKSYGRAPNFLMATGYEQVRSVVAALSGDLAAADDVQLELPETGVCSTQFRDLAPVAAGCCGGSAPASSEACCALDADIKAQGGAGCGCGASPRATTPVAIGCCK